MNNDFETVLDYLTNNKQDKITFYRYRLIYTKNGITNTIDTTNWTNIECQTLIIELNKQYNEGYKKGWDAMTTQKLNELGMI